MRLLFLSLLLVDTEAFSPPKSLTFGSHTSTNRPRTQTITSFRSTSRLYNLNRNYLDSINEEEERRNFRNDRASNGQGNNSGYFNYGGGGAGTAVRPSGREGGYGVGGWNSNAGVPKIVSIKQPQDLLDFVIEDERLSVGMC